VDLKGSTNTCLVKQILKISNEFEVVEGVDFKENPDISKQEKDNGNTSTKTIWVHNMNVSVASILIPETSKALADKKFNSFFFLFAIFLIILLLIIYFLWSIFSHLYSFILSFNKEKIFLKYITSFNRN